MFYVFEENEIYLLSDDNEKVAFIKFPKVNNNVVEITSTYVSDTLRGKGIAGKLINSLYDELKRTGRKAILKCSYAIKWFEDNLDKQDVLWQE